MTQSTSWDPIYESNKTVQSRDYYTDLLMLDINIWNHLTVSSSLFKNILPIDYSL